MMLDQNLKFGEKISWYLEPVPNKEEAMADRPVNNNLAQKCLFFHFLPGAVLVLQLYGMLFKIELQIL